MLHSLGSVRHCRAALYQDCVPGILRIPQKRGESTPLAAFGSYLTGEALPSSPGGTA